MFSLANLPNSILSFAFLFNIFNSKSLSSGEVSFGILFKKEKEMYMHNIQ